MTASKVWPRICYINIFSLYHCFWPCIFLSLVICEFFFRCTISGVIERKSTRVLSTTDEEGRSQNENPIKQVTDPIGLPNIISGNPNSTRERNSEVDPV